MLRPYYVIGLVFQTVPLVALIASYIYPNFSITKALLHIIMTF